MYIKYMLWNKCGEGWQPTPVFLPRESHVQRSLAGYSPGKELDTTEHKALSSVSELKK